MSKQIIAILAGLSVAFSACGTVHGDAPGRAIVPAVAPYDATHLDAGYTPNDGGTANTSGDNSAGPQLIP